MKNNRKLTKNRKTTYQIVPTIITVVEHSIAKKVKLKKPVILYKQIIRNGISGLSFQILLKNLRKQFPKENIVIKRSKLVRS